MNRHLLGFPFFVSGRSASTGQFYVTHVSLHSHEDTDSWKVSYEFVKNVLQKSPEYRMGDAAREITRAGTEVFGDEGIRLMCWPHTFRNVNDHLAAIRREDSKLGEEVLSDIEDIQWTVHNEETFRFVYQLMEDKYLKGSYDGTKEELLMEFFSYFRKQWVDGPVFRWFEGANPWATSHNQGLEGQNKEIKASHTFKRRCPLGTFMKIVARMIEEFSKKDDSILFSPRIDILENPEFRTGLQLKTEGYQWLKQNQIGVADRIVSINKGNKYTVSESPEFQLGEVDKIWAVASSTNSLTDQSLTERAKRRIKERKEPTFSTFKEYLDIRTSCWLIEQSRSDYWCDCPISMKGNICKHVIGMYYRQVGSLPIQVTTSTSASIFSCV